MPWEHCDRSWPDDIDRCPKCNAFSKSAWYPATLEGVNVFRLGASLEVELLDPDGKPIADEAFVVRAKGKDEVISSGKVDRSGKARVKGLTMGEYDVAFAGHYAHDFDLMPRSADFVDLQLLDAQGAPVPKRRYQVLRELENVVVAEGELDERGWAHVVTPHAGRFRVRFPDLYAHELDPAPPRATGALYFAELELQGQDGRPLPNVAFEVRLPDGRVQRGLLDLHGRARVPSTLPGPCEVRFAGLYEHDVIDITHGVPPDPDADWLELELLDAQGRPVAGQAYCVRLPGGGERTGVLDAHGRARVRARTPGACLVTFPGFLEHDLLVDGAPPPAPWADAGDARPRLRLELLDALGWPVARRAFVVRDEAGARVSAGLLDGHGRADVLVPAHGTYHVSFAGLYAHEVLEVST